MSRYFGGSYSWIETNLAGNGPERTVAFWVKPEIIGSGGRVIFYRCDGTEGVFSDSVFIDPSGYVIAYVYSYDHVYAVGTTTLSTATWYHVAVTWKDGVGMKIFLNGTSNSNLVSYGGSSWNSATKSWIGRKNSSFNQDMYFSGYLLNFSWWNTVLPDEEIARVAMGFPSIRIKPSNLKLNLLMLGQSVSQEFDTTMNHVVTMHSTHATLDVPPKFLGFWFPHGDDQEDLVGGQPIVKRYFTVPGLAGSRANVRI